MTKTLQEISLSDSLAGSLAGSRHARSPSIHMYHICRPPRLHPQDLREVSAGPWGPPGDANPAAGCAAALRMRRVAYVKPLRIPIPLAPKQCHVWEEHRLVAKSDGGWVVECKCTNDAPKGDCFYVLVQLCGVHRASGAAQLRITMQVWGMLRPASRTMFCMHLDRGRAYQLVM